MPMPVAGRAGEYQNHDIRPESPDVVHHVAQNLVAIPFLKRLVGGLRESEIDGAREILLGSVDPPGCEQLLAADDPEFVALLGADQVLPTLAAGERQIGGSHMTAKSQIGQDLFALV